MGANSGKFPHMMIHNEAFELSLFKSQRVCKVWPTKCNEWLLNDFFRKNCVEFEILIALHFHFQVKVYSFATRSYHKKHFNSHDYVRYSSTKVIMALGTA